MTYALIATSCYLSGFRKEGERHDILGSVVAAGCGGHRRRGLDPVAEATYMIDSGFCFFLWLEIRMLRLNLAAQPPHIREAIMAYEEKLMFSLIENGVMEDVLDLRRQGFRIRASIINSRLV